jgi:hypothetical protein
MEDYYIAGAAVGSGCGEAQEERRSAKQTTKRIFAFIKFSSPYIQTFCQARSAGTGVPRQAKKI